MRNFVYRATVIILSMILFSALPSARVWAQDEGKDNGVLPDGGWPQVVQSGGDTITIYQPQIESWKDNLLKARSAVSVATKASAQPEFGVVLFSARTSVDRSNGTVDLENISIISVDFPKSNNDALNYGDIIKNSIPNWPKTIALDRLVADLAITQAEMKTQQQAKVKNDPPTLLLFNQARSSCSY